MVFEIKSKHNFIKFFTRIRKKINSNTNQMKCKVCEKQSTYLFTSKIINKYEVKYYQCSNCKFIQTEEPFWLDEVYQNPINATDVGLLRRNTFFSKIITSLLFIKFDSKQTFLDYAGGYGVFTRMMRDIGFDFHWIDPFTKNLFAEGAEFNSENKYSLITVFETFEHFNEPIKEIEKMLSICKNIAFSTEMYQESLDITWNYLGFDHGQHIAFYHPTTISFIAKKFNLNYYKIYDIHFISPIKINKLQLKLIKFLAHPVLFEYIKRNFRSLTMSDSLKLKKIES